ncbi:Hypothetical protein PP7435_CHR2-2672 [Komagataella phaffii CBS 7435]|uniref:Uncharacterized protein n=1 Tax=Komagataella phaffii (strain ATCC 76273 / CBS 7435 / CECT 11047 / NRRL Y-11430 / Wegner 21-1) TaxID=981350 RepID=A0A1G4KQ39_KOMPC|nr:Hypothetical protein BQ9382_C2-6952 [Komagataella phaffii CBS 7435]SCV12128.1 Hypothetical protein PP7435_CHR2-2672 [Komagataella phaffii CBS 7435]
MLTYLPLEQPQTAKVKINIIQNLEYSTRCVFQSRSANSIDKSLELNLTRTIREQNLNCRFIHYAIINLQD